MDAFSELTAAEIREAQQEGLDVNPCEECEGRGEVECGTGSNDPDAHTWVDDCRKCEGSGNGVCPCCDNPAAYLIRGDGRCPDCALEMSVEQVEAMEPAPADGRCSTCGEQVSMLREGTECCGVAFARPIIPGTEDLDDGPYYADEAGVSL